jgi:hypothetical protein
MESSDLHLMINIFALSLRMTRGDQASLSMIFKAVQIKYNSLQAKYNTLLSEVPETISAPALIHTNSLDLPTSSSEFAQVFLKNQHSLYQNWPAPRSYTDGLQSHAMVSLASIVGHVLAIPGSTMGSTPTSTPAITTCLAESEAAVNMQLTARTKWAALRDYCKVDIPVVMCIPILVWSDKAEKSKGMRNRGEAWHMTASIHPSRHDTNTHYLSVGLSKASRDEVVSRLNLELQELQLPTPSDPSQQLRLFLTQQQMLVLVYADILAIVRDSPEKRELLYLKQGNSRVHGITGLSANILAVKDVFVSCYPCYDSTNTSWV